MNAADGEQRHGEETFDAVWNGSWSRGISNPPEVIEQPPYLLPITGLDQGPTGTGRPVL